MITVCEKLSLVCSIAENDAHINGFLSENKLSL